MNIEREIKLHLTQASAAELFRLAPHRRRVASIYYDTPRHDLRRAGIALRLRRDGGRWLQTLKAEGPQHGGLARRAEWELPLRRRALETQAFPREEIRLATGVDLGRLAQRLRPVFETRFTRCSGLVQLGGRGKAELAIDRGRILAGRRHEPVREVELELVSGDPEALLRFAETLGLPLAYESKAERGYRLAHGASPSPRKWFMPALEVKHAPGEAFAAVAAAALAQVGINAGRMRASCDPEYLHQLRVGLRRLRAAFQAFAPALEDEAPLERALRRLARQLGAARDWDVFVALVEPLDLPPRVLRRARARRGRERRTALACVTSPQFQAFLFSAMRWLESRPWTEVDATLAGFAARRLDKLRRKSLRKVNLERAKPRHALRIRIRRLRYAGESFAHCFPAHAVKPYLDALRALQDLLGRLNDIAVARRLLESMNAGIPPVLARRERRLIACARAAWARFEQARPFWRAAV